MSSELAFAGAISFLAGALIASLFYTWWGLGRIADGLYRVSWDIDIVLARLTKHEEQGH